MKLEIKTKLWINLLIFTVFGAVVFYISLIVEQKSLALSLFGMFFIWLMGLLAIMLEFRIEAKHYGLWKQTIISLALTNVLLFVMMILVFSGSVANYLAFSITFTLVQCLITFIKSSLKGERS